MFFCYRGDSADAEAKMAAVEDVGVSPSANTASVSAREGSGSTESSSSAMVVVPI